MLEKVKNIFLYGNAGKEVFDRVYPDITKSCRKNLQVFSVIASVGMFCMLIASLFEESLVKNRLDYAVLSVCSLIIALIISKIKADNHKVIYTCVYIFVGLLFAFGIDLGTFIEPNEVTVSFPILLFAVPLLFTDRPWRMDLAILIGLIAYYFAAKYTQDPVILGYNLSNIFPYGIIAMVVSAYMMTVKIHRFVLEVENKNLIEVDQLTEMMNRRCFEQHIQQIREAGCEKGTMVCAFDLNRLKPVNDNLGHHAGDELIKGAAGCIESVFGHYGVCYRTGGDEFMAILGPALPLKEELKVALEHHCASFSGTYVSGLSIAVGMVIAEDGDDIDELIRQADKEMYEDKQRYYIQAGIERRK